MTHSLRGVPLLPVLFLLLLAPLAALNGGAATPAAVQATAVQAPVPAQPIAAPPAPLPMARQMAVARRLAGAAVPDAAADDARPQDRHVAGRHRGVPRRSARVDRRAAAARTSAVATSSSSPTAGEAGLARVAITGYSEENVQRFFDSPGEPAPADKTLAALVEKYKPATIALSIGGSPRRDPQPHPRRLAVHHRGHRSRGRQANRARPSRSSRNCSTPGSPRRASTTSCWSSGRSTSRGGRCRTRSSRRA